MMKAQAATFKAFTVLAGMAAIGSAASGQVVIQDTEFNASNWVIEQFRSGGGGSVSAVVSPTGNPGNARRVTTSVNAQAGSTVSGFHRFGTTMATRYEPGVQGAIGSISMSLDVRFIDGTDIGEGVTLAIKQGQVIYRTGMRYTGNSGAWVRLEVDSIRGDDFSRIDGEPGLPEFSAQGQPIRFGFFTSSATPGGAFAAITDVDNFRVEIIPACKADFNEDGGVDGSDVGAFFVAWESGDADADVNADGGVDGADAEAFFSLWEAGGC